MNELADGDLSQEPFVTKDRDEIAQLMDSINTMTHHNRTLISEISNVSESVSSQSEELTQSAYEVKEGTKQVSITMEEIAQGFETQADNVSELSNTMGTFNQYVEEASGDSKQVEENSKHVLEKTIEGRQLMDTASAEQSSSSMDGVAASSEQLAE